MNALKARVAELGRKFAGDKATFERLVSEKNAASALVAELERELKDERWAVEIANARADAAETRADGLARSFESAVDKLTRAESEAAALCAQCERDAALAAEWKQTAEEYRIAYQSVKDKK